MYCAKLSSNGERRDNSQSADKQTLEWCSTEVEVSATVDRTHAGEGERGTAHWAFLPLPMRQNTTRIHT